MWCTMGEDARHPRHTEKFEGEGAAHPGMKSHVWSQPGNFDPFFDQFWAQFGAVLAVLDASRGPNLVLLGLGFGLVW